MNRDRTKEFFDSYASDFNSIYGTGNSLHQRLINSVFRKSMRLRLEETLIGCDPISDRSVLDIGCGPGHYDVFLALKGAGHVLGIDLADNMIEISKNRAQAAGVDDRCHFIRADFMEHDFDRKFDYSIVMGVLDYIENPVEFISKVLSLTTEKAFFSFPADNGFLAWQRKFRYRKRCDLFMYSLGDIESLFKRLDSGTPHVKRIARDYFVAFHLK